MRDISIIITVYKNPHLLRDLIRNLGSQISEKGEIVVIADEPNQETLKILKEHAPDIQYFINKKRKGKVHALNFAAKKAKGNILLFLDSDVKIKDDKFVEKIIKEIEDASILDGKIKVITNSLLSRLVSIDYYNMYLSSRLSVSKFKTRFGLNGVCFAIKKEKFFELKGFKKTITEDADFGVRASITDTDMKFSNNLELYTQSPNTWKEWYKQRKRWAIGGSMCILDHFKYLFLKPKIWIPILFTVYPSFIYIFIYMVFPDYIIYKLISLALIFLVSVLPMGVIYPVLFTLSSGIVIVKGAFLAFITFIIWSAIILIGYKKYGWDKIRLYDLPIYYFVYSQIWFYISCLFFIKVFIARVRKKEIKLEDWET